MWDDLRDGLTQVLRWLDRPLRLIYPATLIFLAILTVLALLERSGRLNALQAFLNAFFLIRPMLIVLIYAAVLLGLWGTAATFNFDQEMPWLTEMTDPRGGMGWFDIFVILVIGGLGYLLWQYLGFITTDMLFVVVLTLITALIGLTRLRRFVIVGVDRNQNSTEDDLWSARTVREIMADLRRPAASRWREITDDQIEQLLIEANPYLNDVMREDSKGERQMALVACDELRLPDPDLIVPPPPNLEAPGVTEAQQPPDNPTQTG